jgi:hypothetical protein
MKRALIAGVCLATLVPACGSSGARRPSALETWPTWVLTSAAAVPVPPLPRPTTAATTVAARTDAPLGRQWLELAMASVAARAKDPPASSRAYALVAVAAYDALLAARHWQTHPDPAQPAAPSDEGSVAGAASRVVAFLFPERSAAELDALAESVATGSRRGRAGLALGRVVAEQVINHARADGSSQVWDGVRPPHEPRYWDPPPGSTAAPVQPAAGRWHPWVLASGSALRPPPPPAYGSAPFLVEARELMQIRRDLTPRQERTARFWAGGQGTSLPAGIWNQVGLDYLRDHKVDRASALRALALMNVAMADAGIAAWDAKYTYWVPRPENAIRDLLDPSWSPFLATPLFPAYVSGHSTYSAAAAIVLARLFPEDATHFRALGEEAGLSRLLGGIHWRSDHVAGAKMGREIGRLVLKRGRASNEMS